MPGLNSQKMLAGMRDRGAGVAVMEMGIKVGMASPSQGPSQRHVRAALLTQVMLPCVLHMLHLHMSTHQAKTTIRGCGQLAAPCHYVGRRGGPFSKLTSLRYWKASFAAI